MTGSAALLAGNAFFVAASFALVSTRRSQVEPRAQAGSRRAQRVLLAMDRLAQLMAGAQLGITVCSVALGALAEPALADLLNGPLEAAQVPGRLVDPVAFAVALAGVVFAHVLLGEMVPKNLTLAMPDRAALVLGPGLARFTRWLAPALVGIRAVANGVLRLLGISPPDAAVPVAFGLPEVAAMAAESHREGLLDEEEYRLMRRALAFTSARAADIAIPLDRVYSLPVGARADQVEALAVRTRHMRFPVLDSSGRPIGYVHAKDLLHLGAAPPNGPRPAPAVRPLPVIPAETPLPEALTRLREARAPMAVIGTAGRPTGVLTLDDVFVALVHSAVPRPPISP